MALGFGNYARSHERTLALLDIGSSKVCCLIVQVPHNDGAIARVGAPLPVRRLGFGLTRSSGIRAGAVADLAEAEEAVKLAVAQAEHEAGRSVREVVVSVNAGRLGSLNFSAGTRPATGTVTSADIDRVLAAGRGFVNRDGRELLHAHRLGYRIDAQRGIRNPRGLSGERLSLDLNAVAADEAVLRNIRLLLGRGYLSVSHLVAAPYASALATLAEADLRSVTTVIDMGAETTSYAVFDNGLFLHAGSIGWGGQQITHDIARALGVPVNQAERIKALYGNLVGAMSDEHEYVQISREEESSGSSPRVTRATLRRIVLPRIVELLQLVRERIAASGVAAASQGTVLLSGGASQLVGLGDVAARQFGTGARVVRPQGFDAMSEAELTPAMGVVVGLAFAVLVPGALPSLTERAAPSPAGYVGRLGRWFKDSFWDEERAEGAGTA